MAEQKAWTVTYTARRKTTTYCRRYLTVQVTAADVRTLLALGPHEPFDTLDPQRLEDAIAEIATERGRHDQTGWETTGESDEDQDPDDVEIEAVTHG